MVPPEPPTETPLESWKEIAAFFNITPRTAQNWEEERGMPVHRTPGVKGRVYAYPSELRAWRAAPNVAAAPAPDPPRRNWKPPLRFLAGALALLAGLLFWGFHRRPGQPSAWRLEGQVLIVSDDHSHELWRYHFETPPVRRWEAGWSYEAPLFVDLDGDGRTELLFPFLPEPNAATHSALYYFSDSGEILLCYEPNHVPATRRERFDPHLWVRLFAPVPVPGSRRSRLLIVSTEAHNSPSQVALIDLNGQILREYWHTGHFSALKLADLDSDGRPEIYLAGISNGYKCATLVALDPDTFTGASREDPDYQLMDLPAPREIARILFPRTAINRALLPYNVPKRIRWTAGRLSVDVAESLPESGFPAATYFYFGPRLRLLDVGIADANYTAYQHMYAKGLLPTADPRAELPALRNIRYLTPWAR